MKISLNNKVLDTIDMSYFEPTKTFSWKSGCDHYRLLAHLSSHFNNTTLIDIGTRSGASAIALAKNSTNIVHSFDIEELSPHSYPNVVYHKCKLLEANEFHSLILTSPLISLDVNHDGVFERDFLDFLIKNDYKGLLYLDDIHTEKFPAMEVFWNSITLPKEDVTMYGHCSGSGIVVLDPTIEIVLECECSTELHQCCDVCTGYLRAKTNGTLKDKI